MAEDDNRSDESEKDGKKPGDDADDPSKAGNGDKDSEGKDSEDEEEDSGPPFYKKPIFWFIAIPVLVVIIIAGILWWLHARRFESTDDAFIDAHIVRIAAQTNGRLTRVPDSDNRHVHKGQLLAVIEPGAPDASRAEAVAGVAQADAQIKQAEAQVISNQAAVRQAEANAIGPQADAARAARDYARYLALKRLDPLAAAPTQIDQARANAESTAGQAAAARKQIAQARANVLAARKQVEAARAQRSASVARVQQADVTVGYLRILAPIDGQVVNRSVDVGSYVAPGQQLMAVVPDEMWVTANFKETQLALMRRGQHVDIRIDAYPGVTFAGHVDSVQRGAGQAFQLLPAQNATGNYVKVVQRVPVRILFDGAEWRRYAIGPGMSVVPRVTVRP
ncbi:membrane fusion protein (multidrug efflux system) [Sphingomonas vulcanisoli]|uniref:Membrane fusion protein (Multidrug efflux system) n=1 Tax=Sphingomonas vulcanisoli TaxID=1658060 RepID=A0ABX0TTQ5_9SPHN|nr:HlyD family secretion protein [Sphingomonas vulcanisoli]NIJ07534.1 membrane fusion protein (multidrug efflux system) [Sphingomonas vulcanisoli]